MIKVVTFFLARSTVRSINCKLVYALLTEASHATSSPLVFSEDLNWQVVNSAPSRHRN